MALQAQAAARSGAGSQASAHHRHESQESQAGHPPQAGSPSPAKDQDTPSPVRRIAIWPRLMHLTRDTAAGLLLSQLVYWTRRRPALDPEDGWVFKTAQEWFHETGLSWKAQRRARELLISAGLLQQRKQTMPARLAYRVVLPTLIARLSYLEWVLPPEMGFPSFAVNNDHVDRLLGRGFVYHSVLARRWSVHTAMLCSRLLMGVRLPGSPDDARAGPGRFGWLVGGETPPVRMRRADWLSEIGMTREQWETARLKLKADGVLIERQRNFPRRVDMSVDMAVLRQVLAEQQAMPPRLAAASSSARRSCRVGGPSAGQPHASCSVGAPGREADRQASRNPEAEKQVPVSPFPASTDRPKQPVQIADSRLYLQEGKELRTPQPLVREHATPGGPGWRAFGCGGGLDKTYAVRWTGLAAGLDKAMPGTHAPLAAGNAGQTCAARDLAGGEPVAEDCVAEAANPRTPNLPTAPASASTSAGDSAADVASPPALVWSRAFTEGDRTQAARHLKGLDRTVQQAILDEIEWLHQGAKVRSPVGLVRALRQRADAGAFVPEGAHRVEAARIKAQAHAKAQAQSLAMVQPQVTNAPRGAAGAPAGVLRLKPEIAERLRQVRAGLVGRRVA